MHVVCIDKRKKKLYFFYKAYVAASFSLGLIYSFEMNSGYQTQIMLYTSDGYY